MSCSKCDSKPTVTYVRVGSANVELHGCLDHLRQLLAVYNSSLNMESRLCFLRQWLNEDRITDPQRFVTEDNLRLWLGIHGGREEN